MEEETKDRIQVSLGRKCVIEYDGIEIDAIINEFTIDDIRYGHRGIEIEIKFIATQIPEISAP